MIRVYASFVSAADSVRAAEHRTGRKLLCRGLQELYGLEASSGKSTGDSSGETTEESPAHAETEQIDSLLEKGKYGKPFLKDRPDIHFNISHCRGLVVCAFADAPVGVDVENVKPVRDSLIRRVLHEEEIRVLSRYGQISEKKQPEDRQKRESLPKRPSKDQPERSQEFLQLFFRYWTLKESYLKQDGSGLTKEPREICFHVDPDDWDSPVTLSDPEKICMQHRLIGPEVCDENYVLSVCVPASHLHTGTRPDIFIAASGSSAGRSMSGSGSLL